MGTGICGVILLEFEIKPDEKAIMAKSSLKGFFDNYEIIPKNENTGYERFAIKKEILIPNYADFLTEFFNIIDDEFKGFEAPLNKEPIEAHTKKLLSSKTFDEFNLAFSREARNASTPFIDDMSVSCIGCYRNIPFHFYAGSYKAILESYSTLVDMEKILAKAMTNPLKNAVKFAIFG